MVKKQPANKRPAFDPWVGKSPGGGHGNPLQYSCLENPTEEPGGLQSMNPKELDLAEAT